MQGVTYFMCDVILGSPQFKINEEWKDPFQHITLSDQEEANDEVNVIENDEDGDNDVDVE